MGSGWACGGDMMGQDTMSRAVSVNDFPHITVREPLIPRIRYANIQSVHIAFDPVNKST